jgi:oligopeptide/dipeptide ABC transporter ATP-binding protein
MRGQGDRVPNAGPASTAYRLPPTASSSAHTLRMADVSIAFQGFEGLARVVDRASLEIGPGELVGIVGETGCGKSVLTKAILDLLPAPVTRIEGRIEFDGTDLRRLPARARRATILRYFNVVFQDPVGSLNPFFTVGTQVREVLEQAARRNGRHLSRAQSRRRAVELLQTVHLDDPERVLRSYPFQLSGGMNQRVSIALALSTDPWLIVADEPTTALDVTVQAEILKLFDELVRGENRSVLFITHSMGVVREVADRVAVMYAGVVVEEAPTADLFAHPKHPYTVGLLDCVPRLTGQEVAKGIPGTLPDYTAPPSGCRFHPRCPHAMPICRKARPPTFPVAASSASPALKDRLEDWADDVARLSGRVARHRVACWLYDEDGGRQSAQGQG